MKTIKYLTTLALALALACLSVGAQTPSMRTRPYGSTARQKRQIMDSIQTSADRFRASLDDALSRYGNTNRNDFVYDSLRDFNDTMARLRQNFEQRRESASDVQAVLDSAARIDDYVLRNNNNLTPRARSDWAQVRYNVNQLARVYNLQTPFGANNNYSNSGYNADYRFTGTYSLDPARSDDPNRTADNAVRGLSNYDRQRVYDQLINRLTPPERIAIQRNGQSVTIASSRAPQINFDADGRDRTETFSNGRTIRVNATFYGDQLTINTTGNESNDFSVTFESLDNGNRLRITRRISVPELTQPVVARSVYNRTDTIARFDIYNGGGQYPNRYPTPGGNYRNRNGFIIPDGTTIYATLNNLVSTSVSHDGDPFTMTVQQPSQYAGAIIEGTLSGVSNSGRISGRAQLTFNFDTIRMPDGRTYNFSGFVDSVRTPNGDTVQVDREGTVQDRDNQTNRTIERGAIGAGIGAIIGAIAGGGKGAAIGAVLGGGAGVGSVYIQGRDNLELQQGTQVTIRASSPANYGRQ
jgi:hypothetical protein